MSKPEPQAELPLQAPDDIDIESAKARAAASDAERIIQRYKSKISNRATAIRAKCIECCNGQPSEVRECTVKSCALYEFRMGVDPFNKKTRDAAARAAAEGGDDE